MRSDGNKVSLHSYFLSKFSEFNKNKNIHYDLSKKLYE